MMPEEEPLTRKRRSLLGASGAQSTSEAASAEMPAPEARERTTPVTEAMPRRARPTGDGGDRVSISGAPQRGDASPVVATPHSEHPAGSHPTPPTRDRTSDAWFLASGQSPPERSISGSEIPVAPRTVNPWLSGAPIAGVAAVGLLFVLALAAAVAFLN